MEIKAEESTTAPADPLGRALEFLVLLVVLFHGTQASVNLLGHSKDASLSVCPADLLLWAAFGLWVIFRILRRRLSWPPVLVGICGTIWLILSLVPQLKGAARENITVSRHGIIKVVQFAEYFVAGYAVFFEAFREERARRWAVRLLTAGALVALLAAWVQYLTPGVSVTQVRGTWFADRNTFGAFFAVILPFLSGVYLHGRCPFARLGWIVVLVCGLCVLLAGGPFLGLCLGLLTVAFLRNWKWFLVTALALIALAGFVLPRLPRHNSAVLLDSVAMYKDSDPCGIFGKDIAEISGRLNAKNRQLSLKIGKEPVQYADIPSEEDYSWRWQQHYKEWQASLNMMATSPLFGVGAGCYQKNVDGFYLPVPKYPKGLLEEDTLSGYMIWGASAGVPFLFILFWLIGQGAVAAGKVCLCGNGEPDAHRALAAGIIGSLVALVVVGLFTDPFLVRGLGITVALVLALARAMESGIAGRAGFSDSCSAGHSS